MDNPHTPLYLRKGTLTVKASGYWYSQGGTKGSFGFYPHLKDKKNKYPFFPDTQIKGNLKDAVTWYINLTCSGTENKEKLAQVEKYFGKDGNARSALLKMTDLTLTPASKEKFTPDRFQLKSRIKLDKDRKCVANDFLVSLELCFMDGLDLESTVYLGYTDNKKELDEISLLIEKSLDLLTGIGGLRSRGKGQGMYSFKLDETAGVSINPPQKGEQQKTLEQKPTNDGTATLFLTALTAVRNDPVSKGKKQTLAARPVITGDQVKAWLAFMHYRLYRKWPAMEDMATIQCLPLYPSESGIPAYPPPVTTLIDENKHIEDMWGKTYDPDGEKTQEGFIRTKTKSLPETLFLINRTGTDDPTVTLTTEKRFRNAMDENYTTKKDSGLYIQELMEPGVCFGGRISFAGTPEDFKERIIGIMESCHADIRGALFKAELKQAETTPGKDGMPLLVIDPISGPKVTELIPTFWSEANNTTHIRITSQTAYNTTLMRPRRNRIVIAEGSVIPGSRLSDQEKACTLAYENFQNDDVRKGKTSVKKTKITQQAAEPPLESRLPGKDEDQTLYQDILSVLIKPMNLLAIQPALDKLANLFNGFPNAVPGLMARVEKLRGLSNADHQDERTNNVLELLAATVHLSKAQANQIRTFADPSLSHTYIRDVIEDRVKKYTEKNMDTIRFVLGFFLQFLPERNANEKTVARKMAEFRDLVSRFLLEHGNLAYDRFIKGGKQ